MKTPSTADTVISFWHLLPSEIKHDKNAPGSAEEMLQKLLAPKIQKLAADRLMSIAEIAAYAKCSIRTVKARIKSGELKVFRSHRIVRARLHDVEAMLSSGQEGN